MPFFSNEETQDPRKRTDPWSYVRKENRQQDTWSYPREEDRYQDISSYLWEEDRRCELSKRIFFLNKTSLVFFVVAVRWRICSSSSSMKKI